MAAFANYDRELIFKPIGKMIARFNELDDSKDAMEEIFEELVTVVDDEPSEGSRELLTEAGVQHQDDKSTLDGMREAAKSVVSSYLLGPIREMLDVSAADINSILDQLQDAMYLKGDTVLCDVNPPLEVGATDYDGRFDIDNEGVGSLEPIDYNPQQRHSNMVFEFVCYDISGGAGSEYWQLRAKRPDGSLDVVGTVQTGVWFYTKKYGLAFKIYYYDTIQESGDGAAQLSNWVLNGATKRKGDEWWNSIVRANADFYGNYFGKLYDVAGTRWVELYRDTGLTQMVAQGSRVGDGNLVLAAVGGSGLTGSVDVAYTAPDSTVRLRYPFPFAQDDKIEMPDDITTPGLFQAFFVDEYDKALPCLAVGNTVDEAWAQWTP